LHHADHTGKLITQHITKAAARHPLIEMKANTIVTDLIVKDGVCVGVETLSNASLGQELASRGTVLCSGGLGGIYEHSTNPPGFNALGSSVALAERVGVTTRELEYVQFHPTSLHIPNEARFLLTEALRGEGAVLRDRDGRAFAKDFHEMGELAPRDIVARGVFEESQRTGRVFLDISHRDQAWLYERFPTVQAHLQERGLDMAKDWLPVIPAAHYTCGGISTDLQGKTSLPNLYAAGEAARTGLHGGNRLASTSLLEGLVFGASVAEHVGSHQDDVARRILETTITTKRSVALQKESDDAAELLKLVRKCMWDNVGVIRTVSGLQTAIEELEVLESEAAQLYRRQPSRQSVGVRDAAVAGLAVARAALQNRNSIGAHCILVDESDSEEEDAVAGGM
jgi:L-aspartate oxidase